MTTGFPGTLQSHRSQGEVLQCGRRTFRRSRTEARALDVQPRSSLLWSQVEPHDRESADENITNHILNVKEELILAIWLCLGIPHVFVLYQPRSSIRSQVLSNHGSRFSSSFRHILRKQWVFFGASLWRLVPASSLGSSVPCSPSLLISLLGQVLCGDLLQI